MATATIDHQESLGDIESALITVRRWPAGAPPEVLPLSEVTVGEDVLQFDIVSGADPLTVYEALHPVCGNELTLEMIIDLVEADDMPQIKPQDDARVRAVSGFAVEATERGLV